MKPTQTSRILNHLKDHPEGAYNFEFANDFHILRYSARIFDLRRKGWDIREDFSGHYVLHTEPAQLNFSRVSASIFFSLLSFSLFF